MTHSPAAPYPGTVSSPVAFVKGHGTGNDFVLLPDTDDRLVLGPDLVAALCDRRFGVGADGVIRIVPDRSGHGWFMDYWNSDGSLGEMCGNGARVFARYLVDTGREPAGEFEFVTRGGIRRASVPVTGPVTIEMGPVTGFGDPVTVSRGSDSWSATAAYVPNPHAVAFLPTLSDLGDIAGATAGPDEAFPEGANVEFVEVLAPDRVRMRVWERGSGETLSCGTGACAVAWAHARVNHVPDRAITVLVPGGEVVVGLDDSVTLTGPAEFVAHGTVDPDWWRRHS